MKFSIPVPNWLFRWIAPKVSADLDRRSTLTGKASRSIIDKKAIGVTVSRGENEQPRRR